MKTKYILSLLLFPVLLTAQITPITSTELIDLSVYGEANNFDGEGEYQLYLSTDNILDKPIFIVDGFDPGDTRNISGLYNSLNFTSSTGTENLADLLRDEGFDIVILNFPTYVRTSDGATVDGGADFMERNAMILVELINTINTAKASNNPEQNVIIGPSMGGIISRYALNYMENQSLDADTRLYISFDSPHLGANIPIGLQHQLNYLAFNNTNPVAELQPLINGSLNSPAARQLLLDHFEPHLATNSSVEFDPTKTLPAPHPFRLQFQSNINSLTTSGFPENVRNVAIINGSGINSPYFALGNSGDFVTNGYSIMNTVIPVTVPTPFGNLDIDIEIDINMTPSTGVAQQISRFFAPLAPPIIPNIESLANSGTTNFDGVDAAPGGLFDLSNLTGSIGAGGGIAADFLNALQIDKFSFIPSVSALALEFPDQSPDDSVNWFLDIDIDNPNAANDTPFVNTYLPDNNEPHVQLTEANVAFALSEILSPPLSNTNDTFISFKLENNPVTSALTILSNTPLDANLTIMDLTGKTLLKNKLVLNNRTSIPLNLDSGFYILNIQAEGTIQFSTKFIVEK